MSEPGNTSGTPQLASRAAAKKNAYRKASAMLGFIAAGSALIPIPHVYFLLRPLLFISAVLMLAGGILVWKRITVPGALLILIGGLAGGFFGLPSLLWMLLASAFGNWAYSLPLLPFGLPIPIASLVLAFMSE